MVLHPVADLVEDVVEKPVKESLEIGQWVVVGADDNVAAEEEQYDDSFAGNASGEKLVEKGAEVVVVYILEVHLSKSVSERVNW